MAPDRVALEHVDSVEITTLVDNQWDMLLLSQDRTVRPPMSPEGRPMPDAFVVNSVGTRFVIAAS